MINVQSLQFIKVLFKIILLKPQTYMNLSGNCVIKYVNYFDIKTKRNGGYYSLDKKIGKFGYSVKKK